jgi:hypothetical protein
MADGGRPVRKLTLFRTPSAVASAAVEAAATPRASPPPVEPGTREKGDGKRVARPVNSSPLGAASKAASRSPNTGFDAKMAQALRLRSQCVKESKHPSGKEPIDLAKQLTRGLKIQEIVGVNMDNEKNVNRRFNILDALLTFGANGGEELELWHVAQLVLNASRRAMLHVVGSSQPGKQAGASSSTAPPSETSLLAKRMVSTQAIGSSEEVRAVADPSPLDWRASDQCPRIRAPGNPWLARVWRWHARRSASAAGRCPSVMHTPCRACS